MGVIRSIVNIDPSQFSDAEATGIDSQSVSSDSDQAFGAGLTPLGPSNDSPTSTSTQGEDSESSSATTRRRKKRAKTSSKSTKSSSRKSPTRTRRVKKSPSRAEEPSPQVDDNSTEEQASELAVPVDKPVKKKRRRTSRSSSSSRNQRRLQPEDLDLPIPPVSSSDSYEGEANSSRGGNEVEDRDSDEEGPRNLRKVKKRTSRKTTKKTSRTSKTSKRPVRSKDPVDEDESSGVVEEKEKRPTTRKRRSKKTRKRHPDPEKEPFLLTPDDDDSEGTPEEEPKGRSRRRSLKRSKPKKGSEVETGTEDQDEKRPTSRTRKKSTKKSVKKTAKTTRTSKKTTSRGRGRSATKADQNLPDKKILIDCMDPEELRIAVLEGEVLQELYFDRTEDKKYLGNIYKGRIVNLEPAIQAAFVELGIGRNGFLHVSDVLPIYAGSTSIPIDDLSKRPRDRKKLRIQDILHKGQEILVQISKDSIGAKGPSLTTYVSIPGKNLVLMPGVSRFGVSKKIQDREIRSQLRENLSKLDPPKGLGFIIRTAGKDISKEFFEKDLDKLKDTWAEIREKVLSNPAPQLLRQESDLITRAMRDVVSPEVSQVICSDEGTYHKAKEVLREIMPEAMSLVKRYKGTLPLFSKFKVEDEIDKIYNRRIPLPSGGSLIVEQTEALVSIDVNSGKYTDEEDLEETALKINLEAADEVARQLRLRDLGGVIVNDFIDMVNEENRRTVEKAFRQALKKDRAKCWVSKISRFGIIEMTRQRVRPSLERTIYEPCKHCNGTGMNKSARTIATSILRQLRVGLATRKKQTVEIVAHPQIQSYLLNDRRRQILELEDSSKKTITVLGEPGRHPEEFLIRYV